MKILKSILRNESGVVLPSALILLALGAFLVVPTLAFVTTNLNANRLIERENMEVYAADAGVEEIMWNIAYNQPDFPMPSDGNQTELPAFILNDKSVVATLSKDTGDPYKITSIATGEDGHSTTVESYIDAYVDFSWLHDGAIISAQDVTIMPGTEVNGDVVYGGTLDNKGTINGDEVLDTDIGKQWPSANFLSAYYYDQVEGLTPYPSNELTISGTKANPTLIGPLYRNGNLTFKGDGWAKIVGTVYLTGQLVVNPTGGCTIELNDQTIFSSYYNNCSGDAIYFGPKSTLLGSGAIIAVGKINYQPTLSAAGDKLLGVSSDQYSNTAPNNTFLLAKFTADKTGYIEVFKVYCSGSTNVKLAIYADSAGEPGALLNAVDTDTPVVAGWNELEFPETEVTANNDYWLAANSNDARIRYLDSVGINKTKGSQTYSSFTFPDPAGTGFTDGTQRYLFAGHALPYVFVMSIRCRSDVHPNGNIYGTIAGNAEVEMLPGCSLTWTSISGDELNFPGWGLGSGGGGEGQVKILTYIIK